MSEKKFKVGDKVKIVSTESAFAAQNFGKTLKVISVPNGYACHLEGDDYGGGVWNSDIQLVEQASTPDLSTGYKDDSEKPDMSLIPTDALIGMAKALTYGAKKYEAHNYRKGMNFSRLVAATMRHLSAWNEGENLDKETGLSHLDHALASLAMLKFMEVNRQDMDNRWLNPIHNKLTDEEKLEAAKAMQERGR